MSPNRSALTFALILLAVEKAVQHLFVTAAFLLDFRGIRSTVVVDYRVLVVSGFAVGLLYAVAVSLLRRGNERGFRLLFGLAAFDVLAEFVAQGTLDIEIVVSFVVAWIIIVLVLIRWWRRSRAASADS